MSLFQITLEAKKQQITKQKHKLSHFYFCQKMEFRTYILCIFIHSNELPQSLGGLWCFLLLLSSPFVFFLGFKVIFKIFKLCGMAKQTNKPKKNGCLAFSWFQTHLTILTCLLFFFTIVFTFLPNYFHWPLSLPYRFLFISREKCPEPVHVM